MGHFDDLEKNNHVYLDTETLYCPIFQLSFWFLWCARLYHVSFSDPQHVQATRQRLMPQHPSRARVPFVGHRITSGELESTSPLRQSSLILPYQLAWSPAIHWLVSDCFLAERPMTKSNIMKLRAAPFFARYADTEPSYSSFTCWLYIL